jgi:hypothetical protein
MTTSHTLDGKGHSFEDFQTRNRRALYLAWHHAMQLPTEEILSGASDAFSRTRFAPGRECLLFLVSGYAFFHPAVDETLAQALSDNAANVRRRAMALQDCKHMQDLPHPGSDFWFFFHALKGRAPRGHFAIELLREHGAWLEDRGFRATYAFAHEARFVAGKSELTFVWDSHDGDAFTYSMGPGNRDTKASRLTGLSRDLWRKHTSEAISRIGA